MSLANNIEHIPCTYNKDVAFTINRGLAQVDPLNGKWRKPTPEGYYYVNGERTKWGMKITNIYTVRRILTDKKYALLSLRNKDIGIRELAKICLGM